MTSVSYVKRLGYAKYIYSKGIEALANNTQLGNALAILSFHDAAEIVLLSIADQLGYKSPDHFMQNWDKAEGMGKPLHLKNQMERLNRLRTSFKHHGILPNRDDSIECQRTVFDFFLSTLRDILGLDFNSLSVSDLIENQIIRGYLKEAEKNIGLEQYEEAISEAAKAFAFVMKEAAGDYWHHFIIKNSTFELADIDPRIFSIGGRDNTVERNFGATKKSLMTVKKCLEDIIDKINPLLLGVDNFRYTRFRLLTPMTFIMSDHKTVRQNIHWNVYQNKYNMTLENATFCFNFVTDTALKAQESSLGLVNAQAPAAITITSEKAPIFSLKGKELVEIGSAPKNSIFRVLNKVSASVFNNEPYWSIDYGGNSAFIKVDDAEPSGN
jgi:hypothetical protein